ncbi:MAG TPA: ACP S-malonyltransferase [Kofleriaceae bacterium]|nr:ACP S-malonyltransferase [Kofleriaceae bacterium]
MKTLLLFPGQGAQKVGMGAAVARASAAARRVFEEADEALGESLSSLCFEGPEEALTRTENTQPAILATSIAVLRALEAEGKVAFDACAGHSLGEFSALVAAGALALGDAVKLVRLRGRAMQAAVPEGQGAMAAILGLDAEATQAACEEAAQGQVCAPANFNGGGQIVISGHAAAVERAMAAARARGAKRAVPLKVSAPFHSALMQPAADALADALAAITIAPLAVPVYANVDAAPNTDAGRVRDLLIRQVVAPVRWQAIMTRVAGDGFARALELGPGQVLSGLMRRGAPDVKTVAIAGPDDYSKLED